MEGKSFSTTNSKKAAAADRSNVKDMNSTLNNDSEIIEIPRNVKEPEPGSSILDFQNKILPVNKETEKIDKKIKQKQYVKELEEQIRLRDKIKQDEEQRLIKKRGTIDNYKEEEDAMFPNNLVSHPY